MAALVAVMVLLVLPASSQQPLPVKKQEPENTYLMKSGAYLGFRQVNLSMGEIGFRIAVSCNIKSKSRPRLEFRIDKPKGKKIGSLEIPHTADTTFHLQLTGQLRHAWGVHDLYLVAKGIGEFNISGFSFIHNYWKD